MCSAMGILKWSPQHFWKATFYEYTSAMKGHLVSSGVKQIDPVSRNEFLDAVAADKSQGKRHD